jgi:hypothetical protein
MLTNGMKRFLLLALFLGATLGPMEGMAAVWIVNVDGTGDAPTIQAAIDSTRTGDQILVEPGKYFENLHTKGKTFTLMSTDGPDVTCIDGRNGATSVLLSDFFESPATVVEGFTLQNGIGTVLLRQDGVRQLRYGGAIAILRASTTVRNCIVRDNGANVGGGIYGLTSTSLFEDVVVEGNFAGDGGGIAVENSEGIRFRNVTVRNNLAVFGGGFLIGINTFGSFQDCWFENNKATEAGLFQISDSNVQLTNCVAIDQQAAEASIGTLYSGNVRFLQSTLVRSSGGAFDAPFLISVDGGGLLLLERSILAFNEAAAFLSCGDGEVRITCCDIFPTFPTSPPCIITSETIYLDPMFCDLENHDLTLRSDSPCAEENSPPGCGLIGAFPVGCGTSGLPPSERHDTSWGRMKARFSTR